MTHRLSTDRPRVVASRQRRAICLSKLGKRFGARYLYPSCYPQEPFCDVAPSPVHPDVGDLGRHLDRHQGRARRRAAAVLRRGALHPRLRRAGDRGRRACARPSAAAARVRIVVTGMLVIVATYGLLYWGMLFVAIGRRRRGQHVDEPGVLLCARDPVRTGAADLAACRRADARHRRTADPVFQQGELRRHHARTMGCGRGGRSLARLLPRLGADRGRCCAT